MAFTFNNASVLGLSQDARFFGAGFNYANTQKIALNGFVTDLAGVGGVTGVWTQLPAMVGPDTDLQPLTINGHNFGTARLDSITFSPGLDVKTKEYTANLTVYATGDLSNFAGTYYTGIATTGWQFLESFSENYAFTRKENHGYSYDHSANIRFNVQAGQTETLAAAKALAQQLFSSSSLGIAFYPGYTSKAGRRIRRESYDDISSTCSFNETFEFDNDSTTYSVIRTHQYQLDQNGGITVSENAQLRGIVEPTHQSAANALAAELAGAYTRCNEVFTQYAPAGVDALISTAITSSRTIDIFQNNLSYSIVYTNNSKRAGTYTWDYTQQIERRDQIRRIQENGSLRGRGKNPTDAFNAAKAGFATVKAGIKSRIDTLYSAEGSAAKLQESKQESYSPVRGTVEYTYVYSDEAVKVGTDGIKRIQLSVQDDKSVRLYGRFAIFNQREITQDGQISTLGSKTITATLNGEAQVPLSAYLSNAKTAINEQLAADTSTFSYIDAASISFSPTANTATVSVRTRNSTPTTTSSSIR